MELTRQAHREPRRHRTAAGGSFEEPHRIRQVTAGFLKLGDPEVVELVAGLGLGERQTDLLGLSGPPTSPQKADQALQRGLVARLGLKDGAQLLLRVHLAPGDAHEVGAHQAQLADTGMAGDRAVEQCLGGRKIAPADLEGPAHGHKFLRIALAAGRLLQPGLRLGETAELRQQRSLVAVQGEVVGQELRRAAGLGQGAGDIARVQRQLLGALGQVRVPRVGRDGRRHLGPGRDQIAGRTDLGFKARDLPRQLRLVLGVGELIRKGRAVDNVLVALEHPQPRVRRIGQRAGHRYGIRPGSRRPATPLEGGLGATGHESGQPEVAVPVEMHVLEQQFAPRGFRRGAGVRPQGGRGVHQSDRCRPLSRHLADDRVDSRVRTKPQRVPMQGFRQQSPGLRQVSRPELERAQQVGGLRKFRVELPRRPERAARGIVLPEEPGQLSPIEGLLPRGLIRAREARAVER